MLNASPGSLTPSTEVYGHSLPSTPTKSEKDVFWSSFTRRSRVLIAAVQTLSGSWHSISSEMIFVENVSTTPIWKQDFLCGVDRINFLRSCSDTGPLSLPDDEALPCGLHDSRRDLVESVDGEDALDLSKQPSQQAEVAFGDAQDRGDGIG